MWADFKGNARANFLAPVTAGEWIRRDDGAKTDTEGDFHG
jgi:hypothetical protein